MGQGTFRVVLTGEVLEGFDRNLVVAAVAKLFKCPEPQAERVLQGKSTSLKREMDAQTAGRYQQQLAKSGIACRLEPIAPPPSTLELSLEEDPPEAEASAPEHTATPPHIGPVDAAKIVSVPDWKLVEDEAAKAGAQESAAGFSCPKCGTPQEQSEECLKCGIIFAKYQPAEITTVEVEEEEDEYDDEPEREGLLGKLSGYCRDTVQRFVKK